MTSLPSLPPSSDSIPYDDAVRFGRAATKGMNQFQWYLGEIAARVKPKYGEQTLAKLAEAIEIDENSLSRYRNVFKAYEQIPPRSGISWAVCKVFASQPDRVELINRRDWTKRQAEEFIQRRNERHNGQREEQSRVRHAPRRHSRETEIIAASDSGLTDMQVADRIGGGITPRTVRRTREQEQIRREARAEPQIDPSTLSLSAQERLEAFKRQWIRDKEREFESRVLTECQRRLNELSLPAYERQWREMRDILNRRRGYMTRANYRKILAALHPDRGVSDEALATAFDTFKQLEIVLVDNTESPMVPEPNPFPQTMAEWDELRRRTTEERRARRQTSSRNLN